MLNSTVLVGDNDFGPFYNLYGKQQFDFTLLFEDTILSILPSALLVSIAPYRIAQLWQASRKVAVSRLRDVKITLLTLFVLLQAANLVVWSLNTKHQSRASLAAASLSLAAAIAICALSYLEHSRSVRPSSMLNAYLLLTVFMDAAKVRTLWLREASVLAGLGSSIVAVKLAVLFAEALEKRKLLLSPYSQFSPEATSGLYSQSLFWWLNPMFLLGYKSVIREIDLFPTDDSLASETLQVRFQNQWSKRRTSPRRYELIFAMARCMLGPFVLGIFPRLCQIFFRYMQPLLIRRVTTLISQPESEYTNNVGWGLTAAYGLVYFGIAVSGARYHHRAFRLATMVRGALITTVYSKTMDLSITALDESAAVTLMSTDVQRICDAIPLIHELWACPVDISLAIWLLYSEVGLAMLGPLFLSALAIAGTFAISSRTGSAQKKWLASIQTRVDVTTKALESMKGVKMLGLTQTLHDIVHHLRTIEIGNSLGTRRLFACSIVSGNSTDVFAAGITFTIFVIIAYFNGQRLQVSSAYTALSLVSLLANPIGVLAFTIPPLTGAVGCFDRIQKYLLSSSRNDHRLLLPTDHGQAPSPPPGRNPLPANQGIEDIELRQLVRTIQPVAAPGKTNPILHVVNLTLSWDSHARPAIDDVSFDMSPGVTMLIGPVGCGKSTLLKGLLGEVPSSKGYIYTDALQMAFVGQNPWIQHGTLRENIVGMSNFEHKFYSSVVHVCALEQDFDSLPYGDQTPVGSAGVGLSGGQKLRVALARAVYSRRHIIILDDVFSGLDAVSEDKIFSRLLGKKGLLQEMETTVLLATHAAHRLSYADKIIALSPTGSIDQQGTFPELLRAGGYVSSLAARHTTESANQVKEEVTLTKNADASDVAQAIAVEDLDRAVGDFAVYKYYFASLGYGRTILLFVLMAGFAFFLLFPDLWVKFWTSAVAAQGNSVNGKYLGIMLAFEFIAWIMLVWAGFHTFTTMIPESARQLHDLLLTTIRNAPLSFFTSTDIGQVINRFSQDMSVIDYELPLSLFQVTASSFLGFMQAILICLSAAYFAAVMPLVLGLMYLIQKFYLRTSRQIRLMDLEAKAPLYSNFIESLSGLSTIRAFGWAADFEQRNLTLLDRSQRPFYLLFCIQRWLNLVLDLTVTGLAILLMVLIVTLRTKLDAGLVGVALLSIMNFNLSLTQIIKNYTSLETSLGAISRIKTFVQETNSEHGPQENNAIPEGWPSQGSITFSNVFASYTTDGPLVLQNVNLSVPPGQKIGVVGRSGSGKSSFITTLFHMLEITTGTVQIDDVDLSTIPREQLRRRLNVVTQDPLFIAGTVRANLDPFAVAQRDELLISTLTTVGLWSIIFNAGGLNVLMDPDNLLSHGQRQLFCLARAIVNKQQSSILILDEATASVDLQTDETMQRIIRDEFQNCTIIAVAHRLGTISDFDRVIVLDEGKIVEDGRPGLLLEDEHSQFRKLWDS